MKLGKRSVLARAATIAASLLLSAGLLATDSRAQAPQPAMRPAQIDKAGLLILIRQTLTALDLSNKSGNYTILREISAPSFAVANDASRLAQTFRSQRDRSLDYSGVLYYEPTLSVAPEITKEGMMHFAGFFPSASSQINFEMVFAPVNGQWKLFGLSADIGPSGPVAPMPAPAADKPAPQKLPDNKKQEAR